MTSTSPKASVIQFLQQECGVCSHCISLVIADNDKSYDATRLGGASSSSSNGDDDNCTVCFGISSSSYHAKVILPMIKESLRSYCQVRQVTTTSVNDADAAQDVEEEDDSNQLSLSLATINQGNNNLTRESPTVNLPYLIAVRAHCAITSAKWYIINNKAMGIRLRTAEEVYSRLKEHLRSELRPDILKMLSELNEDESLPKHESAVLSQQLHSEEAGYLGVHILCLPPSSSPTLMDGDNDNSIPPSLMNAIQKQKGQIQQSNHRILHPRKRFRGNDPTLKQGGEPRINLELRVRRSRHGEDERRLELRRTATESDAGGINDQTLKKERMAVQTSSILSWLEKNIVLQWIEMELSSQVGRKAGEKYTELTTWMRQLRKGASQKTETTQQQCSAYAASWRRPYYIQGTYTKSRRDISQTPFYVPSTATSTDESTTVNANSTGHNAMVRKGISSVEEEICPPLARIGCGGFSQLNNEVLPRNDEEADTGKGVTVYGLCKFHASGREDMDVRMLLPPRSIAEASAKSNANITGRPFVCEVFDAHRMPSKVDLENVVKAINCDEHQDVQLEKKTNATSCDETTLKEIEMNENGWPQTLATLDRSHGDNPNGVGVSSPLTLVPASAFSGLQSETEEKVKYYGCVCWSSVPIASDEELIQKLACMHWNEEDSDDSSKNTCNIYPLEIKQSTPLRVLHRRSSDVRTRHVLNLSACRISDHWFRLRMSTTAGTYVKEFVHGDCGRTRPSISSMLGGRTDITELDCEGIAV